MKEVFRRHWFRLPSKIRKPIALVVGLSFVISAGLIGWIPGPGGIPLFLVGVAILATEYSWAERFKRFTLNCVRQSGEWLRARPRMMWFLVTASAVITLTVLYQFLLMFVK